MENKSHNMNTNQAENIIAGEFLQARLTDKKPEGNSLKRVVAVENRVEDELNLLAVNSVDEDTMGNMVPRRDMEKSQPDCLEQSQPDCLKRSQSDCPEQSQPDCLKQTEEKECEMTDTRVMIYKFLTSSVTGPLYKYLRYEILNNVRAVTEVNLPYDDHDDNGDTPVQVKKEPHDPGSNGGQSKIKNHFKSLVFNKCRTDDNVYIGKQEYNEEYAHIMEEAYTDQDEEGVKAVENDIGGGVRVPVTGETHDDHAGVADEAENIGGGASKDILEKEKIPPDNENPLDIKPTVDIDSQEHIESAERFGANMFEKYDATKRRA
jgi:hypothetical protein